MDMGPIGILRFLGTLLISYTNLHNREQWSKNMSAPNLIARYAQVVEARPDQFHSASQVFLFLQEDVESPLARLDQQKASENSCRRDQMIEAYNERCEQERVGTTRPRKPLNHKRFDLSKASKRNKLLPPQETGEKVSGRYSAKKRSFRSVLREPPLIRHLLPENQPQPTPQPTPKDVPSNFRKRRNSILADESTKQFRTEKGTVYQDRKAPERSSLTVLKGRLAPRMRQAGAIPKDWRKSITNLSKVINFITIMVQHCIISLVNHCHEKDISLEPLLTGSGQGGTNFIEALFVHFKNLVRGETKEENSFQSGSPQGTLITLAKKIYEPMALAHIQNLLAANEISFNLVYEKLFCDAASRLDTQMGRLVKGKISQLKADIQASTPETDPLHHYHKLMIIAIDEEYNQDGADFSRFLKLCKLAPPYLRPTFAPLSTPTDSFVHINELSLFLNLAPRAPGSNKKRTWTLGSVEFSRDYVEANPGHLLNALLNFDSGKSTNPRVWKTKSGKRMTKFTFANDHIEGSKL